MDTRYSVKKSLKETSIDAKWNKLFWRGVKSASVNVPNWQRSLPEVLPQTEVKLQYDDHNLYVIFRVQDYYVRAVTTQIHGDVWKDSCVEFFFTPNCSQPNDYFNVETNCCGVLLAQHHSGPRQKSRYIEIVDCQKIKIAGTASGPIRREITKPLTWVLEYAIPLGILTHYADIEKPGAGVTWRANFYKCADDSSHPHWNSWSPVSGKTPDFHRPDCFGLLEFL